MVRWALMDDRYNIGDLKLLEESVILPSQFFPHPEATLTSERKLMVAVFKEGLYSYLRNGSSTGRRARRLFSETEMWIFSDEKDHIYNFISICDVLNLKASYVRHLLGEKLNSLRENKSRLRCGNKGLGVYA